MSYLLDTNTCITFLRHRTSGVASKLRTIRYQDVVLCSVVKAELYYGVQRSRQPELELSRLDEFWSNFYSWPFDDRAAEIYGVVRHRLVLNGTPVGPNDLMIAAIALANKLTLVTHNTREFGRIAGLQVEDWEVPA